MSAMLLAPVLVSAPIDQPTMQSQMYICNCSAVLYQAVGKVVSCSQEGAVHGRHLGDI